MQDPQLALHLPMKGFGNVGDIKLLKNDWSPLHFGFGLDRNLDYLLQCLRPDEAAANRYYHQRNENAANAGDEWEETAQLFRPVIAQQDNANVEWGWCIDKASTTCSNPSSMGILNDLSNHNASQHDFNTNMTIFEDTDGVVDIDNYNKPCINLLHCESDFQGDAESDEEVEFEDSNKLVTEVNTGILSSRKLPQNYLEISSHSMRPSAIPPTSTKCRQLLPVPRVQLLIKGAMRPPPSNSILRQVITRWCRIQLNESKHYLNHVKNDDNY